MLTSSHPPHHQQLARAGAIASGAARGPVKEVPQSRSERWWCLQKAHGYKRHWYSILLSLEQPAPNRMIRQVHMFTASRWATQIRRGLRSWWDYHETCPADALMLCRVSRSTGVDQFFIYRSSLHLILCGGPFYSTCHRVQFTTSPRNSEVSFFFVFYEFLDGLMHSLVRFKRLLLKCQMKRIFNARR